MAPNNLRFPNTIIFSGESRLSIAAFDLGAKNVDRYLDIMVAQAGQGAITSDYTQKIKGQTTRFITINGNNERIHITIGEPEVGEESQYTKNRLAA